MASITTDQIKEMFYSERYEGCIELAKCLEWADFDDADSRHAILIDFLYESLEYCAERGFPWSTVWEIVLLAKRITEQSVGVTRVEAIQLYRQEALACLTRISETHLKIFTDFMFSGFFRHFQLFQWALSVERALDLRQTTLDVHVPVITNDGLADSKPLEVWQYDNKMAAIEKAHELARDEIEARQLKYLRTDCDSMWALEDGMHRLNAPMKRQQVMEFIKVLSNRRMQATLHGISSNIKYSAEELGYLFDQSSIPRPTALGALPKTPNRPPLSQKSSSSRPKTPNQQVQKKLVKGKN